jgi:hypothetical protein
MKLDNVSSENKSCTGIRCSPLVVHVGKETHDELAVHTVGHTTMSRNGVTKVLDVEGTLQTRSEEATEGSNQRSKGSKDHDVELNRGDSDCGRQVRPVGRNERHLVSVGEEDGVGFAFKASEDVGTEIVDRADEVLGAHQNVGEAERKDDGKDPGADEAFDSLFRTDLDELSTTESNTTEVCKDIVGDDQSSREEEPDHALENVVHDEMGLDDNQVESHVGPGELLELELVVTFFKRDDEEDEAHDVEHETDEAVVGSKGQENLVDQDNVLEVVDDTLAVEEVHGGAKEIPVERLGEA